MKLIQSSNLDLWLISKLLTWKTMGTHKFTLWTVQVLASHTSESSSKGSESNSLTPSSTSNHWTSGASKPYNKTNSTRWSSWVSLQKQSFLQQLQMVILKPRTQELKKWQWVCMWGDCKITVWYKSFHQGSDISRLIKQQRQWSFRERLWRG